MKFSIIAAKDSKNWIWLNGSLPWHLPWDLKYFKKLTLWHTVIMWSNTWKSLPSPLKWRNEIIISKFSNYHSLNEALHSHDNAYVIWWWQLYKEAIKSPFLDKLFITQIDWDFSCDVFFPQINLNQFKLIFQSQQFNENQITYFFQIFQNNEHIKSTFDYF